MKKLFLISILTAYCAVPHALPTVVREPLQSKVALKAIIAKPSAKSQDICETVDVEQHATSIEVMFKADAGNINVEVVNPAGLTVFQQTVNATAGSSITINIQNWPGGTYLLRLLNSQENGCEGQFEK